MKKVLFATTALVASAGIASAEVAISGSAEMGVAGGTGVDMFFLQSVDVRFSLTGETDNGLSFGATIDLDDLADMSIGGSDPVDVGFANEFADFSVFISGSFGTLTMGDTDGAFDWALTEVNMGGSIADDETAHIGFNGNSGLDGGYSGQVVRYDHSVGDFSFAVSVEIDDVAAGDPIFGIGGQYSGDLGGVTVGVGVGYQTAGSGVDIWGVSLTAAMDNGFEGRFNYSDASGLEHIGLGVGYTMDAITVAANWGQYSLGGASVSGFGLAANYDLGGGAVVQFGYGTSDLGGGVSVDSYSLGLSMSF